MILGCRIDGVEKVLIGGCDAPPPIRGIACPIGVAFLSRVQIIDGVDKSILRGIREKGQDNQAVFKSAVQPGGILIGKKRVRFSARKIKCTENFFGGAALFEISQTEKELILTCSDGIDKVLAKIKFK